ncbi:DNA repair ATPase [Streptomyces albireticuli]|uniref:DNA repair ATPase n=1 Tax=Streptomyces albireticuli TaxID=1940 RepID=UPI000D1B01E8|nr:DNA repair ATPase [Streptomyces albireticuli]MCD9141001.1 DNA repair ATPase [Streptomyces albireticuli]MCD9161037.1 DNA repair ATPase [Streptomyces albireticuli]MCD9190905.1 DNA repair ATPase [Streptomyces albireticuli]
MITERRDTRGKPGADTAPATHGDGTAAGLAGPDAATYEVLRDRLTAQAGELRRRAEELNARRAATFGSTGLSLLGTAVLRTEHPCEPRDIAAAGGHLLLGVHAPARTGPETAVSDVLTLHTVRVDGGAGGTGGAVALEGAGAGLAPVTGSVGGVAAPTGMGSGDGAAVPDGAGRRVTLVAAPADALPGLLHDPGFTKDFAELHRYYRDAALVRLHRADGKLLAAFRTGPRPGDLRVLRWRFAPDGTPDYLDAHGERDHALPPSQELTWTPATRDDHVLGRHPHVSVAGEAFVSTVGGTLTVKTENTTESAEGVHSEPVDEPLQSLADAEIAHARAGTLLLLRVRPYNEAAPRHFVLDTATGTVTRQDGIGRACLRLPDDQGIVFPGGYHLATGATRTFDTDTAGLRFDAAVTAPNGEDVLYSFRAPEDGRTVLLPYNTLREEAATPLVCHGHALFDDGTLVVLRAGAEGPSRAHTLQVWRTPFRSDAHAAAAPAVADGPLARVGNADLVRCLSACLSLARAIPGTAPTPAALEPLVAACARVTDRFPWLAEPGLGGLHTPLAAVRATAEQVLRESGAVQALTRQAADALGEAAVHIASLVRRIRGEAPRTAGAWVERITELRRAQGRLAALREMPYADIPRVDTLADDVAGDITATARRAVAFLRRPDAFAADHADTEALTAEAEALTTAAGADPLADRITERTEGLQVLTEVVTGLDIGDATVRTTVLEHVGEVLGGLNRARATLTARRRALQEHEGRSAFTAETALLGQAVTGALAAADTPERCEDELGRLLLRLEDLEARFAGHDGFLAELATRRGDVHDAFSARRQSLQDARARQAERLAGSAVRVLETIGRRAAALADQDAVHTYFASDPMVAKVRRTAVELRGLDDPVRADELEGRLTAARQEAVRALRDRADLFADGHGDGTGTAGRTVRLGRHRFTVTTRPAELTLVPHGDGLALALTGTDYRAPVTDPVLTAGRLHRDRLLPSESPEVYRAEHLAAKILATEDPAALQEADLPALVRRAAEAAYDEGYERGVHDHDATALLTALLRLRAGAGLLWHPAGARAAAQTYWAHGPDAATREETARRAVSLGRARAAFGRPEAMDALKAELAEDVARFAADADLGDVPAAAAAAYLVEHLAAGADGFATAAPARALLDAFHKAVDGTSYAADLRATTGLQARHRLALAWLGAYAAASGEDTDPGDLAEAVAAEVSPLLPRRAVDAPLTATVDGLLGTHPRVTDRRLTLRIDEFHARTDRFRAHDVPAFRAYQRQRDALVARERARLRLDSLRPRVMSAFVRNRLVDEVYLPLVGDSLAKQLGTAGEGARTDRSGLLLLLSPPGYGKTTLMEYVADRLGLVFVKVNGPALGRGTTSLDPAEAPDATARQEVEKINFALAAGNNTLLHLDDIQHTSPELLEKFLSLCDAQRRVEGVLDGEPRTYDLRGKRFAVSMAGNPYTGSGKRFHLPDMLANRADVRNLGDVLAGKEDVFALSFVENALTSHPVLAPLAGRPPGDLPLLVRLAEGDTGVAAGELAHPYPPAELDRVLAVLRHVLAARRTVLAVNAAYIDSAARSDATRTEPPFLLQGSYRDMNRITERVAAVMTDAELAAVVDDHYAGEARTLAADAEANLLKLAELRGTLTPEQADRRREINAAYVRVHALGGPEADPLTRAVAALGLLAERVSAVEAAISRAAGGPPARA